MRNKYRRTKTTVSLIRYHFVFCPYRRRKVFNTPGVEEAFKKYCMEVCEKYDIEIIAMECHVDHVHLFVSAPPKMSPANIMHKIKGYTGKRIHEEFYSYNKGTNFWTRSYFVSTAGDVSAETIEKYVRSQKTRG